MEKQIAELRSEILLMTDALRETEADLQELRKSMAEGTREMFRCSSKLDGEWMTLRWLRKMEEEYKETIQEGEEDEAKLQDLETLSFNFSENSSDTNSILMRKPTKHELKESSKLLLDVFSDGDNKNGDTGDISNDSNTSSQPAKCEQQENQQISSGVDTDTSQLMKESEEKNISRNPLCRDPSCMTRECEERVKVDETKEEKASLMERQWIEWMDKQEMSGNQVKAVDRQNTEKQGGAVSSVSEKKVKQKQNKQGEGTVKKIKTYLSEFLNPHASYKWERIEDED